MNNDDQVSLNINQRDSDHFEVQLTKKEERIGEIFVEWKLSHIKRVETRRLKN